MKTSRVTLSVGLLAGLILLPAAGQGKSKKPRQPREREPEAVRQVVECIITRENELIQTLRGYRPRVETYLQSVHPDPELGAVPVNDNYYFGRLEFDRKAGTRSFLPRPGSNPLLRFIVPPFLGEAIQRPFKFDYEMNSFARATLVDYRGLDREHYEFQLVRSEFLSEVRCLVLDVLPLPHAGPGRSKGGIWSKTRITPSSGSRVSVSMPRSSTFISISIAGGKICNPDCGSRFTSTPKSQTLDRPRC